jgi:hypothetical protein
MRRLDEPDASTRPRILALMVAAGGIRVELGEHAGLFPRLQDGTVLHRDQFQRPVRRATAQRARDVGA